MKYLSIDIETTGLDIERDQILQVAAVVEDTESSAPVEDLPHMNCFLQDPNDRYSGSAFALAMNSWIFDCLTGRVKSDVPICNRGEVESKLSNLIFEQFDIGVRITIAGKNAAGFDIPFLKRYWPTVVRNFRHRVIDPGSLFVDWDDRYLPAFDVCKQKAGLEGKVSHDALEDARDVIRVLRTTYDRT